MNPYETAPREAEGVPARQASQCGGGARGGTVFGAAGDGGPADEKLHCASRGAPRTAAGSYFGGEAPAAGGALQNGRADNRFLPSVARAAEVSAWRRGRNGDEHAAPLWRNFERNRDPRKNSRREMGRAVSVVQ